MSFAKRKMPLVLLAVISALTGLVGGAPLASGQSPQQSAEQSAGQSAGQSPARPAGHSAAGGRLAAWSPSLTSGGPNFNNLTIRMVAHSSIDGNALRIHLSNLRGTIPLTVGAAAVAAQAGQATAVAGSQHALTFASSKSVTIAAGAEVTSDPVPMSVKAEQNVLVSIYLPHATSSASWHSDAFDTSYFSAAGDHTADVGDGNYIAATTSWYYLSGLDVVSPGASGTVVAFGDSITDGYNTPAGTYHRWPDYLARRLAGTRPMGVVDAGIGGNRVLTDAPNIFQGTSGVTRFAHDALGQPGVRDVILFEGINDIGNNAGPDGAAITAQDLITGYRNLIQQAHSAGVRIIGGTMLPDKGNGYFSDSAESIRQAANTWIRTSGAFDGVIDFDRALADPADPAALAAPFDSGDHLHPNEAGMQALANAVDLTLLT
jgi:lysophospholipase L1-like esterase